MDDLLQVGVIANTHGVRGEVKVFPTTDDPTRYKQLKTVLVDNGKEQLEWEISNVRFFKQMVIVKFKDVDNIDDVLKYKGARLLIARENAVKLEEDEYFRADLFGLQALDEHGVFLGTIKDVLSTGANDVYVIQQEVGADILVPAIKECILKVDLEQRQMMVHLLPGLKELNER